MENRIIRAIEQWQNNLEPYVKQLNSLTPQFALGDFYSFIYNCRTSDVEYAHKGTSSVLDIDPADFSIQRLLRLLPHTELQELKMKQAVVKSFLFNYLLTDQIADYKIEFSFRITDTGGRVRTILNQYTPITFDQHSHPLHIMAVHTDISHLGLVRNNDVSFINIDGGKSYYNVSTEYMVFDPDNPDAKKQHLSELLTNREIEIASLLASGLSAQKISEELCVSFNTVRTHRSNMLQKTGFTNATELVAQCMTHGLI